MNNDFPDYTKIFEATQRRLKSIKKICSRNKEISEVDKLLFYLVGNINIRINTIFHLLKNNITDGVLPLQRTLFELQIAFDALTSAKDEDKEIYVKLFNKKNNFETTNKLNRFFQNTNSEIKNIATSEEIELLSQLKNTAIEEIKSEQSKEKISVFKQWYEIASGKSLTDLCVEFQEIAYYQCYDEPSNWVHPQRIIENMDLETFSQEMPYPFYRLMISNMYWSIDKLSNNIAYLAEYYNIVESNPLYEYGEKLVELGKQLKLLVEED